MITHMTLIVVIPIVIIFWDFNIARVLIEHVLLVAVMIHVGVITSIGIHHTSGIWRRVRIEIG